MSTIEFEGASYDLTRFSHPGGGVIRAVYLTEATATIHAYHPDIDRVRRAIAPYRVGKPGDNALYQGPLYQELKKRVYKTLGNDHTGADFYVRVKMVFWLTFYISSLVWLTVSSTPLFPAACMGVGAAFVGMNVMHDASHMAIDYGKDVQWNYAWQLAGDMIGMSTLGWRFQHSIQHHIHTDNPEDPDAAFVYPLMRSSADQPHLPIHYVQALFFLPLLCTLTFLFQVYDVIHVTTGIYTWEGLTKPIGHTYNTQEWTQFVCAKSFLLFQWALLWHKGGFQAWAVTCVVGSFILSSVDVPGHFTTHPPVSDKLPPSIMKGDLIDTWLLEQLHHTNTFDPHLNGLFGGLNMQIEHHLFPRISHPHYAMIRPILQDFCKEYNLPYNDYSLQGATLAMLERFLKLSLPPKANKQKSI